MHFDVSPGRDQVRAHFVAGGLERTLHDIGVVKGDVRIRNEGGFVLRYLQP